VESGENAVGEISEAELRVLGGPTQLHLEVVLNTTALSCTRRVLVAAKLTLLDRDDEIRRLRRRLGEPGLGRRSAPS
jgi:hypothetical protein